MPHAEILILTGMGGIFILLSIAMFIWAKYEEKKYYDSLTNRPDAREFLEHWPKRPEPGALKLGGWIALAIGLLLAIMGGAFWLSA